jgi:hypothetical protein
LREGGHVLIDQPNRENLLRHFVPASHNGNVTKRARWNLQTQRIDSDWVVKRNGIPEHNRMSIRLYTPLQMCRLFQDAGLQVEAMYGDHNGEPYRRSSRRLIVVGKKQGRPTRLSSRRRGQRG